MVPNFCGGLSVRSLRALIKMNVGYCIEVKFGVEVASTISAEQRATETVGSIALTSA